MVQHHLTLLNVSKQHQFCHINFDGKVLNFLPATAQKVAIRLCRSLMTNALGFVRA
jgi:hypothetical protein